MQPINAPADSQWKGHLVLNDRIRCDARSIIITVSDLEFKCHSRQWPFMKFLTVITLLAGQPHLMHCSSWEMGSFFTHPHLGVELTQGPPREMQCIKLNRPCTPLLAAGSQPCTVTGWLSAEPKGLFVWLSQVPVDQPPPSPPSSSNPLLLSLTHASWLIWVAQPH